MQFYLLFHCVKAQSDKDQKQFIKASIGYGLSVPLDDEYSDIMGSGIYLQGEYEYQVSQWFSASTYAGFIFTSLGDGTTNSVFEDYTVSSDAFLIGGKGRLSVPIPWFAPYLELGLGASFGKFETKIPDVIEEDSGLLVHIPYAIGVVLGPDHNVDVGFTYYVHPSVRQYSGALAIGCKFSIDN